MEIYIDGNLSNIRFSSAHFIPGEWKCNRLHGHDYTISALISGKLNGNSYLVDFSGAKKILREISDYLDHMVLVPNKNQKMKIEKKGKNVEVSFGGKQYSFPSEEVKLLEITDTTAECISEYVLEQFKSKLNGEFEKIKIEVYEGPGQYASSEWIKSD